MESTNKVSRTTEIRSSSSSVVQQQQHQVQQQPQQTGRIVGQTNVQSQNVQQQFRNVSGYQQQQQATSTCPPIFEQIFRNARFAQGGNATFEGKIRGTPKPTVSWVRKGQVLPPSQKHQMRYDEQTGRILLSITSIGPGDEGEYTCVGRNQYGEAICTVFIQPEGQVPNAQQLLQQQQQQQLLQQQQQQQLIQQQQHQQQYDSSYSSNAVAQRQQSVVEIQRQQQIIQQTTIQHHHEQQQQQPAYLQRQRSLQQQQQQQQQSLQQVNGTSHQRNEEFKVDTFEYRLLREVEYRQIITRRYPGEPQENLPPAKVQPQVLQKPRNSKLVEGSNAVFSVGLGGGPARLTWFKDGQRLVESNRVKTSFDGRTSSLFISSVSSQDSGQYTLLAENSSGCVVSSSCLAVEQAEQQQRSVVDTQVQDKSLAPKFTSTPPKDIDITELKSLRLEARVIGRPAPTVSWLLNNHIVENDNTHKILVNEAGNHALLITAVNRNDTGVITCVATNKSGQASFDVNINVVEKENVVAPKFVERFSTVHVREGEPVELFARAVGTPTPRISWQKDGVGITSNNNVIITSEGGASKLEIPRASASDSAWYQCMAQNNAGSTATRARLFVERPQETSGGQPWRLQLPKPSKVIEPEKPPSPEVIYLRHVERARPQQIRTEQDRTFEPPVFLTPVSDVRQVEGGRAHFECKVHPVGDPTMKIEWYVNGLPLTASSRANLTNRFGFIALDLLSLVRMDSGVYTCVVSSATGSAESSATLTVEPRQTIERVSQHPESWEKIQQLEDFVRYTKQESVEEYRQKPFFTKELVNLGELNEGKNAHFEATLNPVSDPHMRVEWFKDGRPLTASSRISTICNFGYVSLNVQHLRPEDSGTYTARATNRAGEALSHAVLHVIARSSVTGSLDIPEQQKYIQSVEELEAYNALSQFKRVDEIPESTTAPEFKTPIRDQLNIRENSFCHFEARLEPVGDPNLTVAWYFRPANSNKEEPLKQGSRITTFFNFGYVALTIKQVTTHDQGTYICRATNKIGQATTTANLSVVTKVDVVLDSQHPEGLEKIQYLEDSSRYSKSSKVIEEVKQVAPRFVGPLKGTNRIKEMQRAHFETQLEPQSDTSMRVEWFLNGKPLMTANRIMTYHDFGYVALDILNVRMEDQGTYTVVATNSAGSARLDTTMQVETRKDIDTTAIHQITDKRAKEFIEPVYEIEEICKSKPVFVQPLVDLKPVVEGKPIHLEARLEPTGDPTMRVEFFKDGRPITIGSRFKNYYDFGYVALDVVSTTSYDTGEYTIRATNKLGTAHSSAAVRVLSRADIDMTSQNEAALEQISYLEDASRYKREVQEEVFQQTIPTFTKPLKNVSTIELSNVHLEARLQPVGDSTMRVEWYRDGKPIPQGNRWKPVYEFDYVSMDILGVYTSDSGVYSVRAVNSIGEAVSSSVLHVVSQKDAQLGANHESSGLERFQVLEDSSRYRRQDVVDEVVTQRPQFLTKPKNLQMKESQNAHFEAKLEPVTDSNLSVEWFKDGRPITVGSRFRPIHDFGYVALDVMGLIPEDAGVYTCRATNLNGVDQCDVELRVKGGRNILTGSQVETRSIEEIQMLEEGRATKRKSWEDEVVTTQAPVFTTSLKNVEIKELQRAHFESRLIPVSDPTMRVEWFKDGQPIKSGSRFNETLSFGHVALDILQCTPDDIGQYTCRAVNALGQAVTSATLNVHSKMPINQETQHLSSLASLRSLEERKMQKTTYQEEMVNQAPMFTQPPKNVQQIEQLPVHFEARLIPVGDSNLKVEWLKDGKPIQASNRISTMHDFGFVSLDLKWVTVDDTGTYTCRGVNQLGQAVTSANLVVLSKADALSLHEASLEKIRMLEDSSRYGRGVEEEVIVTRPPRFVTQLSGPTDLWEQQSSHYECRIEPYPDESMRVEYFKDGKPLPSGSRFRPVFDFGFSALDLLGLTPADTGEYTCKATNRVGTAQSSIKINVKPKSNLILDTQHADALEKIQRLEAPARGVKLEEPTRLEKPNFVRPLKNIDQLPEGSPAHLEATLTPINDPTMKVEWYRDGKPIPQGHRFKTMHEFSFVAMDILYAYPEDSGTFTCRAVNAAGEAVTTCAVGVQGRAGLELQTLDEDRLKKIRDLEAYERPKPSELEPQMEPPVFITPLNSLENLKESDHAHLECRLTPVNDPNLKVEWYVNGAQIKTGHRFRTTMDFGYVALDILYAYPEDTGVYMCKARNLVGEAVNTCNIAVSEKGNIYLDSQHPEGWAKIRDLESFSRPAKIQVEEPVASPPKFTSSLVGTTEVYEGEQAHFECKVEPIRDSSLTVEWFHNGKPLAQGNRFHTTLDFGYCSLDIKKCIPEDAGEYTAVARNSLGEAVNSINLKVIPKGAIITDSQRPEGLDKIRALEEPKAKPKLEEAVTFQRPVFTVPLQNLDGLAEMETAHFEGRLIPVNDPKLKVEWFKDGKPLEESNRISHKHDFGFVSLDIAKIRPEDEGVYLCKATNDIGEAATTASMKIRAKDNILSESQHPAGLKKIQELEAKAPERAAEPEKAFDKPVFTATLTGPEELWEGQHAHFQCRVLPVGDPNLKYEWFCNGVELKQGSRFRSNHDFGFITLDVLSVIPEDEGLYMIKVSNKAGEAICSQPMRVKTRQSIVADSAHPEAWDKIKLREAEPRDRPEFVDTLPTQPPVFTTQLVSHDNLKEGQNLHLDAFVEPRGDPNLKVEWFKNGVPLTTGSRLRSTFDFGLVTTDINQLRLDDAGIYVAKATNLYGTDSTTCVIKIEDKHWLQGDSLRPDALPKIQQLEQPRDVTQPETEVEYDAPLILGHLNNLELNEGENGHFECRVEPFKDPTLKIEWLKNGQPLQPGAKFVTKFDFGLISMDITKAYPDDEGIFTVRATNRKGEASTSGTLKVLSKQNIYLDTQHPKGEAGLEKVNEVDGAFQAKQQRKPSVPDATYVKPWFIVPLEQTVNLIEGDHLHMECRVEPKEDPHLNVEWFKDGKPLEHGTRYKSTFEFGFVTLDVTDGVHDRDQGLYTCRGYNLHGECFTASEVYVTDKTSLIYATQHPKGEEGLEAIQQLEDSKKKPGKGPAKDFVGMPPKFTSQFQNLQNLQEGDLAHFEASLIPVGDESMRVEWFFNGKPLEAAHRFRTVYAFGMVVLEVQDVLKSDEGIYKCKATNNWGTDEIDVQLATVEFSKGRPPRFTTQIQPLDNLRDGQSAHFQATLVPVGDPDMIVEWFHNGKPLMPSSRIKSIYDFGQVLLDIAQVQTEDTGEYECRARNKYGKDRTKTTLGCSGKGGVYYDTLQPDAYARILELESFGKEKPDASSLLKLQPPKFTEHFQDQDKTEGQSAHFEARLIPIDDPDLKVEFYYVAPDGNKTVLRTGHKFRKFHDFGVVILDVLYSYEEDSGHYECRAWNKLGEDVTGANLKCTSKPSLIFDPQIPKRMKGGLEKIQNIEDSLNRKRQRDELVTIGKAPVFVVPLSNVEGLREGENAHFEARLNDTNTDVKVEWFWNGKPLRTGSRFKTFNDFGFVILEISSVYPEDSGEYSCRASNAYGEAVTVCSMKCSGKRGLILDSQLRNVNQTMDKIAELEGLGQQPLTASEAEDTGAPPTLTQLTDLTLPENSVAHFEIKLEPVGDSSMRIEWFHNGKSLSSGSRVKTINDFGFIILEIAGVYARDAGLYTCKAVNRHGEATSSCTLTVKGRQGIVSEPQLPSQFKTGTESIQKLEENLWKREEIVAEDEKPNPPRFLTEITDIEVVEGQAAHFDTRVEPVGDSSMRIEWYFNGKPLVTGSRVHANDDFNFVSLDLDWTFARDSGEYICRAVNKYGFATTRAKLVCKGKRDVVLESQLPSGLDAQKLSELERGPLKPAEAADLPESPPKFVSQIQSIAVGENDQTRFECRVEPKNDARLVVEWFKDGKPLRTGSRFTSVYDFGLVRLDIKNTYAEDAGEYVCRAKNAHGEDITKATLSCKKLPSIILANQMPKGMNKSETLVQMEASLKKYTSEIFLTEDDIYDADKKQPPRFVTQIQDQTNLTEMMETKFQCQLAPVGDPHMKVEWFLNGKPLPHRNRLTPIYDYGYVAMNFAWVYPEDSGEYICRATNLYGTDETKATIKTTGKPGIVYDSQLPEGMQSIEKIREMEAAWQRTPEQLAVEERKREAPVFVTKPEPVEVYEGDWARFVCRVTGFPRPRVLWLVNGRTVMNGTRYKLTHDGMWHLDIPKTRQYDHGTVEVLAKNSLGEAYAKTELIVRNRHDDYRGVLKNSPRPWYDMDLKTYQEDRGTELTKVFEDRQSGAGGPLKPTKKGPLEGTEKEGPEVLEWQERVKAKKNDEYYGKIKELEEEQVLKEQRIREMSRQQNIQGEKKTLATKMASNYEQKVAEEDQAKLAIQEHANRVSKKDISSVFIQSNLERTEQEVNKKQEEGFKLKKVKTDVEPQRPLEPSESSVHGKEMHTSTSKQVQKETQGDLEITRKITATETSEMEHKAKTTERVVQGPVKPARPPFFTKKIQPCRAYEKEQGKFEVEFDGDPLPTIKWFRENFPIQNSDDFTITTFSTKSILVIREVFMEDSGVFSVVAENRGGAAKCSANLVVEEKPTKSKGSGPVPPSFLTTIQDKKVKAGTVLRFDAQVSGAKPLDIYWLKNGKKIVPDARHKISQDQATYSVIISNSVPGDSGKYEIVAINQVGEARCEAEATVEATGSSDKTSKKQETGDVAPVVVDGLKGLSVPEGQVAVLKCRIQGRPSPTVKWTKNDKPIKASKYFKFSAEGDAVILRISETFPEDEGAYAVTATNPTGTVASSCVLKILPQESSEAPPTMTPLQDVTVDEGSPAQFRTQVTGNPTIQWFREGALIPQSDDFAMIHEGPHVVLLIKTTYEEDTGTFSVRATNSAGQAETSALLTVKSKD